MSLVMIKLHWNIAQEAQKANQEHKETLEQLFQLISVIISTKGVTEITRQPTVVNKSHGLAIIDQKRP